MKTPRYRPHDLLFLRLPDRFDSGEEAWPDWLDASWLLQAPLVVRREAAPGSLLPVGARGAHRNQRCKGYIQRDAVARCITPAMLARAWLRKLATGTATAAAPPALPAPLQVLAELSPQLRQLGLAWGPAGGAGFYLACGLPVLRADSDLDLLVRAPQALTPAQLAQLLALQEQRACRVDIQIDTGHGGFALAEYARGGRVLLKTAHGPQLLADPWQPVYPQHLQHRQAA